jgi:hypothetical protein
MKKEMLFNCEYYTKPQQVVDLYYRYIKSYPDKEQYSNIRKTILKALYIEVQNEKSYLTMKRENTQAHDILFLPLQYIWDKLQKGGLI